MPDSRRVLGARRSGLLGPPCLLLLVSCSSAATPGKPSGDAGSKVDAATPPGIDAGVDAGASMLTLTGVMVDYETLDPVPGLTVTDNGATATTDATGTWTLSVPASVTSLSPTITGPSYSMLAFPTEVAERTTVDFGTQVIPDSSTFSLEQSILGNVTTQALVQVVVAVTGSCASAVGGTLTVLSPAGTTVRYFSTSNIPDSALTSFQAVTSPRSAAVIYNITPGAALSVQVSHPTCTQAPFPVAYNDVSLTGQATTTATEPGDNNGALLVVLE